MLKAFILTCLTHGYVAVFPAVDMADAATQVERHTVRMLKLVTVPETEVDDVAWSLQAGGVWRNQTDDPRTYQLEARDITSDVDSLRDDVGVR